MFVSSIGSLDYLDWPPTPTLPQGCQIQQTEKQDAQLNLNFRYIYTEKKYLSEIKINVLPFIWQPQSLPLKMTPSVIHTQIYSYTDIYPSTHITFLTTTKRWQDKKELGVVALYCINEEYNLLK